MDLLADGGGQREADLPYLSVPDEQVELIVYVQFATVEPHEGQRFRRHPGRSRSYLEPPAYASIVLEMVLQSSTRRLGGNAARPFGGHRLQIV